MNFIIKFLVKHWGHKLRADTIYSFFEAIPIDELMVYVKHYETTLKAQKELDNLRKKINNLNWKEVE